MKYTKRNFLKKIATLFDPMGLLAQFTIRAKMLLQDMWTTSLEWDEEMGESLNSTVRDWLSELHVLNIPHIPRCLQEKAMPVDVILLHTFVAASENAYGAVVYARYSYQDGSVSHNIVAAKTRVAHNIATSISSLELTGAVVGARLTNGIATTSDIPISTVVFWSESKNVLWWIRGRSRQFKLFVSNRVGEIKSNSDPDQWRHVLACSSLRRGTNAANLKIKKCDQWWKGQNFFYSQQRSGLRIK